MKEEAAALFLEAIISALVILQLPDLLSADPRARIIDLTCSTQTQQNSSIYVPNFFATMENVGLQMRTASASDCLACLENASASLSGRALNTGCFMRYSDTNFLNPTTQGNGSSRGIVTTSIVIAAISVAPVVITHGPRRSLPLESQSH